MKDSKNNEFDTKKTEGLYHEICKIIQSSNIKSERFVDDKNVSKPLKHDMQVDSSSIDNKKSMDDEKRRIMKLINDFERDAYQKRYSKLLYLYEQLQEYNKKQEELKKEELIQEASGKIKEAKLRISKPSEELVEEVIEEVKKSENKKEVIIDSGNIDSTNQNETNTEVPPAIKAYQDNIYFYNSEDKDKEKEKKDTKSKRTSFLEALYYKVNEKKAMEAQKTQENENKKGKSFDQYK